MAEQKSRTDRIIGILSSLMVVVFAAILVVRLTPWGWSEEAMASEGMCTGKDKIDITLELKDGPVGLELWCDVAPAHVERIASLAAEGFYNGVVFHRVIDGFMAQTGDPTGTGMGGSDLPDLKAEFNDKPFERGTLGMARSADPDSANSQFFITFGDTPHLNGQYTVFGKVVSGMEHVDAIKKGDGANGMVNDPDSIVSMTPAGE